MKSEFWEQARAGDLRGAADAARKALSESSRASTAGQCGELHLVCAFCAMRQGQYADALRELDAAELVAGAPERDKGLVLRIATWRAELAYFQGRYSVAGEILETLIDALELNGDAAYAAFALRIRIAILLADFRSPTTFALEFRKRFGMPPSRVRARKES